MNTEPDTIDPVTTPNFLENILVVDIETTGTDPVRHGIVEIGAVWLLPGREPFQKRCRILPGREIEADALLVNGTTRREARDKTLPWETEAVCELIRYVRATAPRGPVVLAGMNPGKFDLYFLTHLAEMVGLAQEFPFSYRSLDLHTVAVMWALRNGRAVPAGGLRTDAIYAMLGVEPEPKPHRALTGAAMEAEAIRRMLGVEEKAENLKPETL